MASNRFERQQALIAELLDEASDRPQDFRQFLAQCVDLAPLETLEGSDNLALIALAQQLYDDTETLGDTLVSIREPGTDSAMARLSTACVDRPFLVDSLSMAIRDTGASIDWLIHPVMRVERDDSGRRVRVVPRAQEGGREESYIRVVFDPLAGQDAYAELEQRVRRVLADLQAVVEDYVPMRRRAQSIIADLKYPAPGCDEQQFAEAQAFLEWLDDDHFTFLGFRETRLVEGGDGNQLEFVPDSGLGLLRDERTRDLDAPYVAPATELQKYIHSSRLAVITKSAARSHIHHPDYMDSISLKHYDERGDVVGTYRFLGLFATNVYVSPTAAIPIVRRKLDYVVAKTRLPADSHAAKSLRDVIESLPRDELFQGGEDELYEMALAIRALRDRQQLKFLMRRDRYGRFYSCLIFMPRDRYGWQVRERMAGVLQDVFDAVGIERQVQFMRDGFARLHFMVRTHTGTQVEATTADIESRLLRATRTWQDALRDALNAQLPAQEVARLMAVYGDAFPAGYTSGVSAEEAAVDIACLESLSDALPWKPRFIAGEAPRVKLYMSGEPESLSAVLPTLEQFGLSVMTQHPYQLECRDRRLWIQEYRCDAMPAAGDDGTTDRFETVMTAVRDGRHENDHLNSLVFTGGLDWRRIGLVRTWLRYLVQTGMPYSPTYMAEIMSGHGELIRGIVEYFEWRFDPEQTRKAEDGHARRDALLNGLDALESLDADRLLRGCLAIVDACLRTNYYQCDAQGQPKSWISLKLNPGRIPELPKPLPAIETFVYSPEIEGVHLRGGMVARGGLRWSDRREDFRTEVLGLMKAQMVKNAVIVPVGSKGGFVTKQLPTGDRQAVMEEVVECYRTFIRGMLDITDNLNGQDIVKPQRTVCYDDDDPYLVVAADKGTATFSDIANGVAAEYGFWLGDAFASGGAKGYDHKGMGITARGAWESVKRHFRELGRDVQSEDFSVIGVGDMSGDVFGNGMLLSRHIRLLAAFDHRDIFIDPNPDIATSWNERQRLFEMPGSTWKDYDAALISSGGGVFDRKAKSVRLTPEIKELTGLEADSVTPNELMHALLKSSCDLLWFGGIGTYVKAAAETHAEAGDRANDGLRVNGRDLRCRVIGEGGNLGVTQLGRVEFARNGGRLNTDAVDNSAGVDCSDHEVNIKILVDSVVAAGEMTGKQRDRLLAEMTDEVGDLVLRDNYLQTQTLTSVQSLGGSQLPAQVRFMRELERNGLLDRDVEQLPNDEVLEELAASGDGLSRPELSVLMAYAKMTLYDKLLESDLPEAQALEEMLVKYFPRPLRKAHLDAIRGHRLRREIIATVTANSIVNRTGVTFVHDVMRETGASAGSIARSYVAARELYGMRQIWNAIELLDNEVPAQAQTRMYLSLADLIRRVTMWLLRNCEQPLRVTPILESFAPGIRTLMDSLPELLGPSSLENIEQGVGELTALGVPEALARTVESTEALAAGCDIVNVAAVAERPVLEVGQVYFSLGARLGLDNLRAQAEDMATADHWQQAAVRSIVDDLYSQQRALSSVALSRSNGASGEASVEQWCQTHAQGVERCREMLEEFESGGGLDVAKLALMNRFVRRLIVT